MDPVQATHLQIAKGWILCIAMLVSLQACATTADRLPDAILDREGSHEQCLFLRAGEQVRYSYRASDEVEFNVHYHVDDKTNYAVRSAGEARGGGDLSLDTDWRACFMWTNSYHSEVRLHYRLSVQDAE